MVLQMALVVLVLLDKETMALRGQAQAIGQAEVEVVRVLQLLTAMEGMV